DGDEGDADRQQALVEIRGAVEAAEESALEDHGNQRRDDEGERQRDKEVPAELVDRRNRGVPTHQRESVVRQVDEVHHPQRHRQPDRQQEQQHPVGDPVEQDAEDGSERHGLPLQPVVSEAVAYFLPADPGSLTFSTLSITTLRRSLPTLRTCRMEMVWTMSRVSGSI